jgi:hypothetical protein
MVIDEAEYITFSSSGARFVIPTNPDPYTATVDADKVIRERQIAEHRPTATSTRLTSGLKTAFAG